MNTIGVTSIIYVLGEVVISLLALGGSLFVLLTTSSHDVQLVAAGLISAVSVFWFQRRASEQSQNKLQEIADGNLKGLQAQIAEVNREVARLQGFQEPRRPSVTSD